MDRWKKLMLVAILLSAGLGAAWFFRNPDSRIASPTEQPTDSVVQVAQAESVAPVSSPRQGVPSPIKEDITNFGRMAGPDRPGRVNDAGPEVSDDAVARRGALPRNARVHGTTKNVESASTEPPSLPRSFEQTLRPPLPQLSNYKDERRAPLINAEQDTPKSGNLPPRGAEKNVMSVDPAVPAVRRSQVSAEPVLYTIVNGDTLRRIARRQLGNAERFMEIYDLNRDVLKNPERLPIGRRIKIPSARPAGSSGIPQAVGQTEREANSTDLVPLPNGVFSRSR